MIAQLKFKLTYYVIIQHFNQYTIRIPHYQLMYSAAPANWSVPQPVFVANLIS